MYTIEGKYSIESAPSDKPRFTSLRKQWISSTTQTHFLKEGGKGVKACILDTGVDLTHQDIKVKEYKDFTHSSHGVSDIVGHGTHCAGIILSVVPSVDLYIGKVLNDKGEGSDSVISSGIEWAISKKVDVISLSLGGDCPISKTLASTIRKAVGLGITIVAAAGNSGPYENTIESPGNLPECLTVGAIDCHTNVARFSSRGAYVDLCAPGVDIESCYPGKKYAIMSGTSMATPFVAGIACLAIQEGLSHSVKLLPHEIEEIAKGTAHDICEKGPDFSSGYGVINTAALLKEIRRRYAKVEEGKKEEEKKDKIIMDKLPVKPIKPIKHSSISVRIRSMGCGVRRRR